MSLSCSVGLGGTKLNFRTLLTRLRPCSGDISLLSELDQQYNKLVRQYETLIASKHGEGAPEPGDVTSGVGAAPEAAGAEAGTSAHFEKKLNAIFSEETRRKRKTMITPNYRPQYKQLFREAFSVLKDMQGREKAREAPNEELLT